MGLQCFLPKGCTQRAFPNKSQTTPRKLHNGSQKGPQILSNGEPGRPWGLWGDSGGFWGRLGGPKGHSKGGKWGPSGAQVEPRRAQVEPSRAQCLQNVPKRFPRGVLLTNQKELQRPFWVVSTEKADLLQTHVFRWKNNILERFRDPKVTQGS